MSRSNCTSCNVLVHPVLTHRKSTEGNLRFGGQWLAFQCFSRCFFVGQGQDLWPKSVDWLNTSKLVNRYLMPVKVWQLNLKSAIHLYSTWFIHGAKGHQSQAKQNSQALRWTWADQSDLGTAGARLGCLGGPWVTQQVQ